LNSYAIEEVIEMLGKDVYALNGKTILWTGTGGFLGQWITRVIKHINTNTLELPCKLLAYDMRLPDKMTIDEYSDSGIYFRSHDLTTKLWPTAENIDYVVHMAGIASPFHYKRRPLETIDVAIEGVRSTLEIARHNNAKFLFTSSSEVYQTANEIPTPESFVGAIAFNNDRSCYDVSKLMAENLTYVYHKNFGVNSCCVRIFNSFGAGMSEADSRILPRIASAIKGNFPISIFSHSELPSRTYCPAGNTVAGIFLALIRGAPGEAYNIGVSSPELNVQQLIDRIESACGIKVPYNIVAPEEVYINEPLRRCPDISKAENDLGYRPSISLDIGLNRFFHWTSDNYFGLRPN